MAFAQAPPPLPRNPASCWRNVDETLGCFDSRVDEGSFRKVRSGAGSQYYRAEAAGLRWLRVNGGPPIPAILNLGRASLDIQRIHETTPTHAAAERFGRELAVLHSTGAEAFGAPPPDAPELGWIADVPMPYGNFASFGAMYAELRIRPYVKICREADLFEPSAYASIDQLCEALVTEDSGLIGPIELPARLHGDLWSGNMLWAPDETGSDAVWLIDPAAHGGHRESDLAMLALFGSPQLDRILAAYHEAAPLAPGWRDRMPLHQVYPLLVHAILFGGGYAHQVLRAVTLSLKSLT